MKRTEIIEKITTLINEDDFKIDECEGLITDEMNNIINHFEDSINEVRSLIDITSINNLSNITDASDLLDKISTDLY